MTGLLNNHVLICLRTSSHVSYSGGSTLSASRCDIVTLGLSRLKRKRGDSYAPNHGAGTVSLLELRTLTVKSLQFPKIMRCGSEPQMSTTSTLGFEGQVREGRTIFKGKVTFLFYSRKNRTLPLYLNLNTY